MNTSKHHTKARWLTVLLVGMVLLGVVWLDQKSKQEFAAAPVSKEHSAGSVVTPRSDKSSGSEETTDELSESTQVAEWGEYIDAGSLKEGMRKLCEEDVEKWSQVVSIRADKREKIISDLAGIPDTWGTKSEFLAGTFTHEEVQAINKLEDSIRKTDAEYSASRSLNGIATKILTLTEEQKSSIYKGFFEADYSRLIPNNHPAFNEMEFLKKNLTEKQYRLLRKHEQINN
jgi:hypothetical protein